MTDPLIEKAVALKKELADVDSPELQAHMDEIMKLILGAVEVPADNDVNADVAVGRNSRPDVISGV